MDTTIVWSATTRRLPNSGDMNTAMVTVMRPGNPGIIAGGRCVLVVEVGEGLGDDALRAKPWGMNPPDPLFFL
ncbi:MAG: hypothetical protein HQL94_06165 [Magnetococcales bacterium]|nr:hypothetical protein [Magnetococcales bacterium]